MLRHQRFDAFILPRSASAVIAYRMHRDGLGYDDALAAVRTARPSARPNEGFAKQLRDFEAALRAKNVKALEGLSNRK